MPIRLPRRLIAPLSGQKGAWLVTGAAGFIGSNLVQALLEWNQQVRGVDDYSTGHAANLEKVRASVTEEQWRRFDFVPGDIRGEEICARVCQGIDLVLHQAALGSVPASLDNPLHTHEINVTGTLRLFHAARLAGVRRLVYASSCAVYGDDSRPPLREDVPVRPLSPYAASKAAVECYAGAFDRAFGFATVGLRYFNVYGPSQDPHGPYAAVIPAWSRALLTGRDLFLYGDGETSRDYCHVWDVVQANVAAALTWISGDGPKVYNVGSGRATTLNELYAALIGCVGSTHPAAAQRRPIHTSFRPGDIRHSHADLSHARQDLGYEPQVELEEGLALTLPYYEELAQSSPGSSLQESD